MKIKIEYFTDILCIWAYAGQIRIDELKKDFSEALDIKYRFVPIFAAAKQHIIEQWHDKGGFTGFHKHLQDVAGNWDHIQVHPSIWTEVAPESSSAAHIYLKAIQLLEDSGEISSQPVDAYSNQTLFEQAVWLFRHAFFQEGLNIATRAVQDDIAGQLKLPIQAIHALIDCGEAHAAVHLDDELSRSYRVPGSPTMVLNEGRQLLYGNVGYRIIDANVRELLHDPTHGEASWC